MEIFKPTTGIWMKVSETAMAFRVGQRTVRRWIDKGLRHSEPSEDGDVAG